MLDYIPSQPSLYILNIAQWTIIDPGLLLIRYQVIIGSDNGLLPIRWQDII